MVSVGDRIAQRKEFAGPLLDAFAKELERFRPQFALQPNAEQGKQLAPALVKVLVHVETYWDAAREDQAKVEKLVGACETSLHFINTYLKGPAQPAINLKTEWTKADRSKFEEGVKAWQAMLSKSPYA
jgi:hypothetical protein